MTTPIGLAGASHRGLCPLAAAPIPAGATFQTDGTNKYGVYSLFPGGPSFGSTLYSHTSTIGRFASSHLQQSAGSNTHLAQKDVLFPSWSYTFGTPTPPPGSPYSPIPVTQLELFAKSINSSIIIQQQQQQPADLSLQKVQENHCDDKCCTMRPQKPCNCQIGSPIKILRYQDSMKGCSRTNPLDWSAVDVKKEPESYSGGGGGSPIVKLELASPCRRDEGLALRTSYPSMAGPTAAPVSAGPQMGGAVIQCASDERGSGLTAWQVGGACNSALAAPTFWQYPASLPVEPVVSVPVPVPPVGFQLVREPSTGGLLLLPTTGIEPLQQTVVWPGYQQPSSMLLPSLSQISPPPLQLLSSSSEYLSSSSSSNSTTMHQHTQTHHGTRVLTLTADPKKKMPLPIPTTLIKIETEANKSVQTINAAPVMIYQHPTNLILSQTATPTGEASTSPVPCLTPPPEQAVQDASNQTDTPVCSEDDNTTEIPEEAAQEESYESKEVATEEVSEAVGYVEPPVVEAEESKKKPDLSGLELLTNSIMEIESQKDGETVAVQEGEASVPDEEVSVVLPPPPSDSLGGLNLLCALAEQRIMEESDLPAPVDREATRERKRKKKKSKKTSSEPDRKRRRSDEEKEQRRAWREECRCRKSFRSPASKEEKVASESACAKAMALDMRLKLADLQRQYREKQAELSKLKTTDCPANCHEGCQRNDSEIPSPRVPETEKVSTPDKHSSSSSKKRKVEKPKKLASPGENVVSTETIVAKKPKTSFVGYLLKAKEKFKKRSKSLSDAATPLRYLDEPGRRKSKKSRHSYHNDESDDTEMKVSKVRPKLKAEATFRLVEDDVRDAYEEEKEDSDEATGDEKAESRFALTAELLEVNKLRVLTAMGGLFYAGQLNALEPPDVYSITLDGERGNKPHIMSREEILRDAIVEVSPRSKSDLPAGTRLCAYWSQQYRCLYPGTVAEPVTPDSQIDDKRFMSVEFDDGDSGTIAIEDIRLLPPDYPIVDYDPNPLLSLSKRKRRVSMGNSLEGKPKPCSPSMSTMDQMTLPEQDENDIQRSEEARDIVKDKKRAKKRKHKERSRDEGGRKKKKKEKHNCTGEDCTYRKHHKKRKKRRKSEQESNTETDRIVAPPTEEDVESSENDIADTSIMENVEEEEEEEQVTSSGSDDVYEPGSRNICTKRERKESSESKSKISAFLPAMQWWSWAGKGHKRQKVKGRYKRAYYKSIERGEETITIGDSAVFLSTGRPDRPYIGKIVAMFETSNKMLVRVKWFYHPEETKGCPPNLQYPGALFESPHVDENDIQTISHKCDVLPLEEYRERLGDDPQNYAAIYNDNDVYYLAGYYDTATSSLTIKPGIPFKTNEC